MLIRPFTIPGQTVADSLPIALPKRFVRLRRFSQANQIAAFSIVNGTGALSLVRVHLFSGTAPTAVVMAGNFLYRPTLQTGPSQATASIPPNGVLTPLSGSPFAIAGFSFATDYLGQHLYVAGPHGHPGIQRRFHQRRAHPCVRFPFPCERTHALDLRPDPSTVASVRFS